MSKVIKKITKPISRGLDKIVPNELKPLLPYAAAFMPYLLPAGGIFSSMAARGLASAGANAVGQLAQEGNEGELNALSLLLAGAQGAGTAQSAGSRLRGMTTKGGFNPTTKEGILSQLQGAPLGADRISQMPGINQTMANRGFFRKLADFGLEGSANLADKLGTARDTLGGVLELDPTSANFEILGKAATAPIAQGSGDLAYAQGVKQKKDFDRTEAQRVIEEEMRARGLDQQYIDSVTASMTAYGYTQAEIDAILELQGYEGNANGGRIGYRMGGGIMNTPEADFISMDEVVENIGGDEMNEGIMQMADMDEGKQFLLNKKYLELLREYTERDLPNADSRALTEANEFVRQINLADGGSVLPQGMEMDYRQGGMIPMGSAERADDVPARVSKNEFVMTADAVRAAGGGSVNKGAQKMYQLMNNLEARS